MVFSNLFLFLLQADDITTVQTALTGLKLAARIASYYGVDEVIDNLVVTLCKFTTQLAPGVPKASVLFGTNKKAHLATESVFFIANRCVFCIASITSP